MGPAIAEGLAVEPAVIVVYTETVARLQSVLLGGQLLYAAESRQRLSSALESGTTVGRKL